MLKLTTRIFIVLGMILTYSDLVFSSPQNRTALLIGNAAYQEGRLSAPVLDARALAKVLQKFGFKVTVKTNLDRKGMKNAIRAFSQELMQRPGVGLFYYSGHGLQDRGINYLIPIGASQSLKAVYDLPDETVSVNYVLNAMTRFDNPMNLVFLDSCRTQPTFVKSWAKGDAIPPGMAKQSDVPGSLIAYAAAPGKSALDGKNGQNSPYVKYLLEWIQKPNLSISDALTQVRSSVMMATKKGRQEPQQPQFSNALNKLFYFNPRPKDERRQISCPDCPRLLRTCRRHFQAYRLTSGKGGTALDCYVEVLRRDRNNAEALAGLEEIEAKYVVWIEGALGSNRENKALQYMAGLRKVNPESPKLAAFERQMQHMQVVSPPPPPRIDTPQSVSPQPRQGFSVGKKFRDRLKDGGKGPEMVWIPAGSFQMGGSNSDEKPVHDVSVGHFAMGRYEVTVGEFRQFVSAAGYKTDAEKKGDCWSYKSGWKNVDGANWHNPGFSQNNNHPVVCVSWNDATAYAKWLSQQTRQEYRLPTEAEWEYAARAGTTTKYWWGNNIGSNKANCSNSSCGDSFDYTAPVGSFARNPFGLYDTAGNVYEWVRDFYDSTYYSNSPPRDPKGPSRGTSRVLRGGAWNSTASGCRAAIRYHLEPGYRIINLGFRLLRQP